MRGLKLHVHSGGYVLVNVDKAVSQFLANLRVEQAASPLTIGSYRGDLKKLTDFCLANGIVEVSDITSVHIRHVLAELQDQRKYHPNTVARWINAWRSFFRYCLEQEYITKNPMTPIKTPKRPEPVPIFLNEVDARRLLAAPEQAQRPYWQRDRAALELLIMAGLRRSELIALNWDDIDFGAGTITVRKAKGRKQRVVPMHSTLREHLWEYLQSGLPLGDRAVIVGQEGKRIEKNALYRLLNRNLRLAGVQVPGFTLHKTRHTFASMVLRASTEPANLFHLKELLGHQDFKSVAIYSHVDTRQLRDLVSSVRFR